jgi:hypothetical protein
MFDRVRAAAAVEGLTPFGRGQLATLCLIRVADLIEDSRIAGDFPLAAELVHQLRDYSTQCAEGNPGPLDPSILDGRVREFLGPDEEPYDELPGWGAWAMDIVSLADYVLRTWRALDGGARQTLNVLLAAYSIAGGLEDDSNSPDVPQLADEEFRRQLDDAARIAEGEAWGELIPLSIALGRSYTWWVQHVAA